MVGLNLIIVRARSHLYTLKNNKKKDGKPSQCFTLDGLFMLYTFKPKVGGQRERFGEYVGYHFAFSSEHLWQFGVLQLYRDFLR